MRKFSLLLLFNFYFTFHCTSQIQLADSDLNNLVALGEYYSGNVMLTGRRTSKDLEKFRTARLGQIIDVLQTLSKEDTEILSDKFLTKPSKDDLILWYVIREIHYNLTDEEEDPKPSIEVAKRILSSSIDEKWLLDNYYFRIQSGIARLFNTHDFSQMNINLDGYNLVTPFEKACLYFNLMNAFTTRFKVLQFVKNDKKIIEFANKMPKFNGLDYYKFQEFDFADFEWIGHKKSEMYNERHIGALYQSLLAHLNAAVNLEGTEKSREIYQESILSEPELFKYSEFKSELQQLFKSSKKKR